MRQPTQGLEPWRTPSRSPRPPAISRPSSEELLPSILTVQRIRQLGESADQHNQYVLPTASQLASWRAVFQSLLAGAWGSAHLQARTISSTYNVVQFLDTPRAGPTTSSWRAYRARSPPPRIIPRAA